jgi:hypothetical protein
MLLMLLKHTLALAALLQGQHLRGWLQLPQQLLLLLLMQKLLVNLWGLMMLLAHCWHLLGHASTAQGQSACCSKHREHNHCKAIEQLAAMLCTSSRSVHSLWQAYRLSICRDPAA